MQSRCQRFEKDAGHPSDAHGASFGFILFEMEAFRAQRGVLMRGVFPPRLPCSPSPASGALPGRAGVPLGAHNRGLLASAAGLLRPLGVPRRDDGALARGRDVFRRRRHPSRGRRRGAPDPPRSARRRDEGKLPVTLAEARAAGADPVSFPRPPARRPTRGARRGRGSRLLPRRGGRRPPLRRPPRHLGPLPARPPRACEPARARDVHRATLGGPTLCLDLKGAAMSPATARRIVDVAASRGVEPRVLVYVYGASVGEFGADVLASLRRDVPRVQIGLGRRDVEPRARRRRESVGGGATPRRLRRRRIRRVRSRVVRSRRADGSQDHLVDRQRTSRHRRGGEATRVGVHHGRTGRVARDAARRASRVRRRVRTRRTEARFWGEAADGVRRRRDAP